MRLTGRWRPPRPMEPPARSRAATAAIGAVVSALFLSACSGPHRNIDSAGAASEIRTRIEHSYHPSQVSVTCPPGVADRVGEKFTCQALVDGQPLTIDVTVTNSAGRISLEPREALITPGAVASSLASEIEQRAGQRPAVTCPARPILIVSPGGTFTCSAVFTGQTPRAVTVKILDAKGDFSFELAPAG